MNGTERHLTSPLGDMREHPVPCRMCRRMTGNVCGLCSNHCDHSPVLEDIATVLADHAAHTMIRNVHAAMDEVAATIPDDADPGQVRDIKATVGMVRLLADIADEHPTSGSAWQMLASALSAVQSKSRALITGVLAVLMLAVGLAVAPVGVPHAAAATIPNPSTTTTTTTTTTTVTRTVTTTVTAAPVVRRKSVVSGYVSVKGYASPPGFGMLNLGVQTRHLNGKTYAASAYSPVYVQRMVGRTWRTVLTVTTDKTGLAYKTIIAPSGRQSYRLIRPEGATVTAATSPVMVVYVPSTPGC